MKNHILFLTFLVYFNQAFGQVMEIPVINPSFEGIPAAGQKETLFSLKGWYDIAPYYFKRETPPDVQNGANEFFEVKTLPQQGSSYLGMVVRQNETWEMVSQKLSSPLERNACYEFSIHLARSEAYFSGLREVIDTTKKFNFNKPVVLRIWGGNGLSDKKELLAESPVVEHASWKNYRFTFKPKQKLDYLILEAFYKTPVLLPYNGNILLDNASSIIRVNCPKTADFAVNILPPVVSTPAETIKQSANPAKTPRRSDLKPDQKKRTDVAQDNAAKKQTKKILTELDSKTLKEGQVIRIEKLFFEADSCNFTPSSLHVLNEIYQFLHTNPKITIEIGGHTNGVPDKTYCDELSLQRAKSVAEYLYQKGIPKNRIVYKGYGKDKPIATNKTKEGRDKNQRVEIKILRIK
ncbi:MAG TPA: OmpA family protein [Saprospiraceae bacterium]|nr:OmpA family protein [Saprospirales bacterium]HRQ28923.1 OmpA family protein [Saprospiraceae bacterium]